MKSEAHARVDGNTDRYGGLLQLRVNAASDALRLASRKEFTSALASYRDAVDTLLAYIDVGLKDSRTTATMRKTLTDRRVVALTQKISLDRRFSHIRLMGTKASIKAREWAATNQWLIGPLSTFITWGAAPFIAAGIRFAVVGTAVGTGLAIAGGTAFVVSMALGEVFKKRTSTSVRDAEEKLARAYEAYDESQRNESIANIARALAEKRKAVLWQTLRRLGMRMIVGGTAGGIAGSLLSDASVASGATVHGRYGVAAEVATTADSTAFYENILRLGGWFVVKNPNGTYELFYYDEAKGAVRHALSGVKNVNEITESKVLEVSQKDLVLLKPADRAMVGAAGRPWWERPLNTLFDTNGMTEDEMRGAGIYTLNSLPESFPDMTPDYWGRIATALGTYTDTHETVTELSGPGLIDRFATVFYPGTKGLPNKDVMSLFGVLFDDVHRYADLNPSGDHPLPDGQQVTTAMKMVVQEERTWFEWMIGRESNARAHAAIDALFEGKSEWWKAVFMGHELGHLIQHITHADKVFNLLPAGTREEILREMHDFHDFQIKLRAEGVRTNYKGWTEETFKLAAGGADTQDTEIFADMFSKILTNPAEVKLRAPKFYEFMRDKIINCNTKLRTVVAIP